MSKKTLALVTYHSYSTEILEPFLVPLLQDHVVIEKYPLDAVSLAGGISVDLVLLSTSTLYQVVKQHILNDAEVIIADHTLMKAGVDRLKRIPGGTRAMLVNINYKVCIESILLIHQLGFRNLELIPVYPGSVPMVDIDLAITPGEPELVPTNAGRSIDLGHRVFSISTIADIAAKLDKREILETDAFHAYAKTVAPPSLHLDNLLGDNQILNKQLDTLLNIVDKAIIITNAQGVVHSYNARAQRIVGFRKEKVIGENVINLLPEIPHHEALEKGDTVYQKLITLNGSTVAVTVSPIIIGGNLYGTDATFERFTEIEEKQHKLRVQLVGKGHKAKYTFKDILGTSKGMKDCKKIARRMADSTSSILIMGESGTGKELFAQAIHNYSARKEYQFVAVNCAALPESLLESELFGYVQGAFSGAKKEGKMGLFELAHRGTLFLDEIGEISPTIQVRLLRVLQERSFMRIGGDEVISVDVRIIAATNSNLEELIHKNLFRQDLYYRLNVLPLSIPPLRNRRDDIRLLIDEYTRKLRADFTLSEEAWNSLLNHEWHGNVRELINCVEYLSNIDEQFVSVSDLPINRKSLNPLMEHEKETGLVDDLVKNEGNNLPDFIFVLESLENAYTKRERVGRRSLAQRSRECGLFLTEQEIRGILLKLQQHHLVSIKKGRGGTKITELGKTALYQLRRVSDE